MTIDRTWDGAPAAAGEVVLLRVDFGGAGVRVEVDAPFHGDPPPAAPPGRCDGLWDHEVVELFLVGPGGRYLEVEMGPHGHWLGLILEGPRNVVDATVRLDCGAAISGGRWRGTALLPSGVVPAPVERWNAFAIHGVGDRRRYLAAHPVAGARPDFHRIDRFPAFGGRS